VLLDGYRSNDLPSFGGAMSRLQGWLPQARQESTVSDEVYEHSLECNLYVLVFGNFVSTSSDVFFRALRFSDFIFPKFLNFIIFYRV
jgi:hypothetical protein